MVVEFGKCEHGFVDCQEFVFNKINMKHEAYFAGKLDGNSVIRQMEYVKQSHFGGSTHHVGSGPK